ncbi:HCP-like protein [Backusella circina FSU 941]|nr:HCP-like protein [Backusella circina FSU 941]
MSNSNSKALTKEQLFAYLECDRIIADEDLLSRAKDNDGEALKTIGLTYYTQTKDHSKAMAWFRLAANQNRIYACHIGRMYANGLGVSQDHDIAMEYYLKAAGSNNKVAMDKIGFYFLEGRGVPLDKYKASEWFTQSGKIPEIVEKLNKKGIHLTEEDKEIDKTIYQLIDETEDIIREGRKKKKEIILQHIESLNEKKLANLRREIQKLQTESQQQQKQIVLLEQDKQNHINGKESSTQARNILEQQLDIKEETIKSLKRENMIFQQTSNKLTEVLESLVQSKNNEIDLLKRDNLRLSGIEQENRELKRRLEERQETMSLIDNNTTTFNGDNSNRPNGVINHNGVNGNQGLNSNGLGNNLNNVRVKIEDIEPISCGIGNKKRKVAHNSST